MKHWHVYLAKCGDGTLYCGITTSLRKRMRQHNDGTGAKYTRGRQPIQLAWSIEVPTKHDALTLEYRIKQMSRMQKWAMIKNAQDKEDK